MCCVCVICGSRSNCSSETGLSPVFLIRRPGLDPLVHYESNFEILVGKDIKIEKEKRQDEVHL